AVRTDRVSIHVDVLEAVVLAHLLGRLEVLQQRRRAPQADVVDRGSVASYLRRGERAPDRRPGLLLDRVEAERRARRIEVVLYVFALKLLLAGVDLALLDERRKG